MGCDGSDGGVLCGGGSGSVGDEMRLRKVGGLWFFSVWRIRVSFCVVRKWEPETNDDC